MFCGWDWGSTVHGVCLIDDQGAVVKRWMVQHTEDQLMSVFRELPQLVEGGDAGQVPIAIERGEGLVVGLIAGAGHPVGMVEPAAFMAARRGGGQPARSQISVTRSCLPTTPEPMATGCAVSSRWRAPPEN